MTTQADLEKLLDTFNKAAIEFFDAAVLAGLRDMYLSVDPRDEAALKRVDEVELTWGKCPQKVGTNSPSETCARAAHKCARATHAQ
jgi:hypothetical protein